MWIGFPSRSEDAFTVGLRQRGEVREAEGRSQVAERCSASAWQAFTTGNTFIAWPFPLHNGEAFGLPGRWILFLTGFAPSLLYLIALRMWWLKRQAHRRRRFTSRFLGSDPSPTVPPRLIQNRPVGEDYSQHMECEHGAPQEGCSTVPSRAEPSRHSSRNRAASRPAEGALQQKCS